MSDYFPLFNMGVNTYPCPNAYDDLANICHKKTPMDTFYTLNLDVRLIIGTFEYLFNNTNCIETITSIIGVYREYMGGTISCCKHVNPSHWSQTIVIK